MTQKTPLKMLELQGGNIARHNKRVAAEKAAAAIPLTPDRQEEVKQLDLLIAKTLKACGKGSVRNKKGNPAFSHLAILMRLRSELLRGGDPEANAGDVIRQADELLGLTS